MMMNENLFSYIVYSMNLVRKIVFDIIKEDYSIKLENYPFFCEGSNEFYNRFYEIKGYPIILDARFSWTILALSKTMEFIRRILLIEEQVDFNSLKPNDANNIKTELNHLFNSWNNNSYELSIKLPSVNSFNKDDDVNILYSNYELIHSQFFYFTNLCSVHLFKHLNYQEREKYQELAINSILDYLAAAEKQPFDMLIPKDREINLENTEWINTVIYDIYSLDLLEKINGDDRGFYGYTIYIILQLIVESYFALRKLTIPNIPYSFMRFLIIIKHMQRYHSKFFKNLFEIDAHYRNTIDNQIISDDLRGKLQLYFISKSFSLLSNDISIEIVSKGKEWSLIDKENNRVYSIRNSKDKLNVFGPITDIEILAEFSNFIDVYFKISNLIKELL
jgi:hypothetical protein